MASRRGEIKARARVSGKTNPGECWMPFHYVDSANWLTSSALDSISSTPEYKVCAVRVDRILHPEIEPETGRKKTRF